MHEKLVTTWFGESMPRLHQVCIASWIAQGREAIVYSYRDKIDGLPPKATVLDGEPILSQRHVFFSLRPGVYANFSDIFRMEMLRRGLGTWVDADYFMIRDFPEFDEVMIGIERGGWPCNAVMYLPPEHPIAAGVVDGFFAGGVPRWSYVKTRWRSIRSKVTGETFGLEQMPHGQWGRHALVYYTRKLGLRSKLQPQDRFFAEETYTGELFDPTPFERVSDNPEVSGAHLFNKRGEQGPFEPGSFMAWAEDRVRPFLA